MFRTCGCPRPIIGLTVLLVVLLSSPKSFSQDAEVDLDAIGHVIAQRGVAVAVRNNEPVPLTIGIGIVRSDRIRTAVNSKLEIQLSRGGHLVIGADSNVLVENFVEASADNPFRAVIRILSGITRLVFEPLSDGSEVDVHTTGAVAMVRGTEFVVSLTDDDPIATTSVFVVEGEVAVQGLEGAAVLLGPGDGVDIETGDAAGPVRQWGAARVERVLEATSIP